MANTAELLKEIQDGMDDYRKAYDESMKGWEKQQQVEDKVIRKVLTLTKGQEFIDKVDSFVGRRIMKVDANGGVTIMTVENVRFDKWEIVFYGNGVKYTGSTTAWAEDRLEVKYNSVDDELKTISIAESVDVEEVIRRVEEAKKEAVDKAVQRISQFYDDSIETIKKLSLNPTNLREDTHMCSRGDGTDKLGEICQWSWRELIRDFGTDEQKAEVFRNDCHDEVENVG
jgi:hypothetical protein